MSSDCLSCLVTGANGFVGQALVVSLRRRGIHVAAAVRGGHVEGAISSPNLAPNADWRRLLVGRQLVVHSAARVHVMREKSTYPLAVFREVNVAGTLTLAEQAASAGVRRFVFISSIKVNGEATFSGRPFRADDPPAPVDPYGVSKREAECGLFEISRRTGMEVVVVRSPLVYGAGVKGNFRVLTNCLRRGFPLPLGCVVANRRSFVSLENLVDLLCSVCVHPAAAGQIFLVSDGEDLSTADLLRRLASAMGRKANLLPVPLYLLRAAGLLGFRAEISRLTDNLQADISKTQELLGWVPVISVEDGLRRVVAEV